VYKINLFTECVRLTLYIQHKYIKLARVMHTKHICNSYSAVIKYTFSTEESVYKEKTIVKVKARACL